MRKQIATQQKDFSEYINVPLVIGDVQAYEIVHDTPYDLSGVTFKVTAVRADGELIYDVGDTNGTTATYTLKNNMYNVAGITKFRLTLISDDGTVLTSKELIFNAIKENGEAIIDGDDRVPALDTLIINITEATIRCENAQLEYDVQSTKVGVKHKSETEFTYTDFLKGEKGDKGDTGDTGEKGDKGDTGSTGKGISSVTVDSNNHLQITYTDNSTVDVGAIDGYTKSQIDTLLGNYILTSQKGVSGGVASYDQTYTKTESNTKFGKASASYKIAPSDAVNKEFADLVLTGTGDAIAIQNFINSKFNLVSEVILTGTATKIPYTNTVTLSDGSAVNDFYNDYYMEIDGMLYRITDYVGASKILTLDGVLFLDNMTVTFSIRKPIPVVIEFLAGNIDLTTDLTISKPNCVINFNNCVFKNINKKFINSGDNNRFYNLNIVAWGAISYVPFTNTGKNCIIGISIDAGGAMPYIDCFTNSGDNCFINVFGKGSSIGGLMNSGKTCVINLILVYKSISNSGSNCVFTGNVKGAITNTGTGCKTDQLIIT